MACTTIPSFWCRPPRPLSLSEYWCAQARCISGTAPSTIAPEHPVSQYSRIWPAALPTCTLTTVARPSGHMLYLENWCRCSDLAAAEALAKPNRLGGQDEPTIWVNSSLRLMPPAVHPGGRACRASSSLNRTAELPAPIPARAAASSMLAGQESAMAWRWSGRVADAKAGALACEWLAAIFGGRKAHCRPGCSWCAPGCVSAGACIKSRVARQRVGHVEHGQGGVFAGESTRRAPARRRLYEKYPRRSRWCRRPAGSCSR